MNITKAPCNISRNLNLSNGKYNVSESEVCEVKGGVFKDCKYAWTSCKTELRLFRMSVGNKIATWRFGGDVSQSESVGYRVTCVCELPARGAVTGSAAPQLLVGLDCGPGRGGAVCICDSSFGSIIATIDVLHPVSSLAVIDGGASPGSRLLSPAIANMCGVAAVGLTGCGYVMLVNLRRHDPDGPHTTILLNEASFKVPRLFALMGSDGKVQRFLPSYTVDVTCLQYVPCITSLLVGYNFGCFEIWDLRDLKIRYVSPVMEQTIPVAHIAFQEPLDDPCNFCYVWAVHSPSGEISENSSGACHPVAVMYALCYQWKEWVDGCGYIYEDFKECSQHYFFEMKTFENKKTLGGSSITCQAVGTAVSRQHRSLGPDDFDDSANEGELSLCLFAWQTIDTDCKSLLRVALFDLDRWYKEQMPQSGNGSYIVVFHLEDTLRALTNPVLDVVVDESSLQPYHSDTGHEEDYRPSALSFGSTTMGAVQKGEEAVAMKLGALLDAGAGAVVTLIAGDTQLVAHRAVLSARSPVFAAMFAHEMVEASSGEVVIPDVGGAVLRELVSYLYTLQAPQLPDMALPLLAAADKYGVSGLKADCERQAAAQLTVENAAAAAVLAVRHDCPHLKRAAVAFIKSLNYQVMATQGWADAMVNQPEDLKEINRLLAEPSTGTGPTADTQHQPHGDHGSTPSAAQLPSSQPDGTTTSSIETLSPEKKRQKLINAAEAGAVEEVRKLLAAGADVGARDDEGRTALHWAAYRGDAAVVKRLLEAGAQVDATNDKLDTPLNLAARCGRSACVRLLLAFSANPNTRDHSGYFPLHWAACNSNGGMIVELLDAGANKRARNCEGLTPLDIAMQGLKMRFTKHEIDMLK